MTISPPRSAAMISTIGLMAAASRRIGINGVRSTFPPASPPLQNLGSGNVDLTPFILLGCGLGFLPPGALAYAGRLAGACAQVVELRAAHVALALELDRGDERRVGLEGALDALAGGDLAHHERRIQAAVLLGDDHALEGLHALSLAFHHVDVHDDRIAGREIGDVPREALDFFLFDGLDQIHGIASLSRRNSSSSSLSSSLKCRTASRSGLLSQVRPSACFSRQRRMFSW